MTGRPLRPGTDIHRIYLALSEFPGVPMTTRELMDETGLPLKQCSGYMWTLRQRGLAQSRPSEQRNGQTLEHWVGELL